MKLAKKLRILLWKELKEISRDKKLVATTILFPLVSLPAIGFLTALLLYYQPVVIAIVNEDAGPSTVTSWFIENVVSALTSAGHSVVEVDDLESALRNATIDLILIIPGGFHENATSFDKVAYVEIIRRAGVSEERVNRVEQ
ncbi:MAG: ABC transporter permease, partial [Desulfurococcaceae archaeon]